MGRRLRHLDFSHGGQDQRSRCRLVLPKVLTQSHSAQQHRHQQSDVSGDLMPALVTSRDVHISVVTLARSRMM